MYRALIAHSDARTRETLARLLEHASWRTGGTGSFHEADRRLKGESFDLLFTQRLLQGRDARRLASRAGTTSVLIAGRSGRTQLRAGSDGFAARISPPFEAGALRELLDELVREDARQFGSNRPLRPAEPALVRLLGESRSMKRLEEQIRRVAPSDAPVLIHGETGSGKELVARTLHELSRRRHGPFLAINCGALTPSLMESQLFGHERGSFTGATRRHRGVFERTDGGTLFLDEVTEMPLELQAKLLRALETGAFHRTGGERLVEVDVRVIAATNRVPERAVQEGRFRADLYYRLRVVGVKVPALRERFGDIGLLAQAFLTEIAEGSGEVKRLRPDTLAALAAYSWPGNVRELKNVIHSSFVMTEGAEISPDVLPPEVLGKGAPAVEVEGPEMWLPVGTTIEDARRRMIRRTLSVEGGNKTRTAEVLGICLKTLYARLNEESRR